MKAKKAEPSYTNIDESGHHVMSWRLSDEQNVPAIEQSVITIVRFPILYYQQFNYSPEAMALRPERIKQLGWFTESFDLPLPPAWLGSFCLLSDALDYSASSLKHKNLAVRRLHPSLVKVEEKTQPERADSCVLYFNHYAYEFYHFFFILGKKNNVTFENIPDPPIQTLDQAIKWVKSFERKRRLLYRREGFTWEPDKKKVSDSLAEIQR